MSTGNNKDDTIVSKKRKRVVRGYIHPNKPEIKKFDFFTGARPFDGVYRMHNSKEFLNIVGPTATDSDQVGSWQLVRMVDPDEGTTSYQRVGMKYFLKYIKFKGHIAININCPFTLRYKLVLIKTDYAYNTIADFMAGNMCNYEPITQHSGDTDYNIEWYCRHNFYKTYKWAVGMAEHRTSMTTVSSGTLTPADYVPRPTKTSTLGSNPSWAYTLPDLLRFGGGNLELNQMAYLPLNVSVQVNDNVEVGVTHFYLLLMVDHGIGVKFPAYDTTSATQTYYMASKVAPYTVARFNFFGCSYFTDL